MLQLDFAKFCADFASREWANTESTEGEESARERERERETERTEKANTETRKQMATKQFHGPKPMKSMDKIHRNLFVLQIAVKKCISMIRASF